MAAADTGASPFPLVSTIVIFMLTLICAWVGVRPLLAETLRRERYYGSILRNSLLMDVNPRSVTVLTVIAMALCAFALYALTGSVFGGFVGIIGGVFVPTVLLRYLRRRRLRKLEDQLVPGIQSLASGVRAGLNLVQSMQLIARDGPVPIRQEFAHLLREYEYGVPLDEAMNNAAVRIGSGDFRLLLAALHTHRERGGDLGQTLDRIGASIREIQRLEKRVHTLTAHGRATARWLGVMPIVVLGMLYLIDREVVRRLFIDDIGKIIIGVIILLNVIGFMWIRKVVSIDI